MPNSVLSGDSCFKQYWKRVFETEQMHVVMFRRRLDAHQMASWIMA